MVGIPGSDSIGVFTTLPPVIGGGGRRGDKEKRGKDWEEEG
jgi:hypothetical protein